MVIACAVCLERDEDDLEVDSCHKHIRKVMTFLVLLNLACLSRQRASVGV